MSIEVFGMPPGTRRGDCDAGDNFDVDVYLDGVRVPDVVSFDIDRRTVSWLQLGPKHRHTHVREIVARRTRRGRVMVVDNVTGRIEL